MKADANRTEAKTEVIPIAAKLTAGVNRQIIAETRGHEIVIDIRKERGGDDAGPTPPELLAIALY
jgi:putative redox protein